MVLCLVFLVLIRQKIMWSQFPPNLSQYSCVIVSVFLLWFPPNLSCLQNNPPENNVGQFPPNLSCLQNNPPENNVEDLAGTRFTLFSSGLFWHQFLLDLQADRAYGTEISPRSFVISFVILLFNYLSLCEL